MMNGFGMMSGYGAGAGFGIVGLLMMIVQLVFWGAVIYLIYVAIKKINTKEIHQDNADNSLKIIRERYASGQINEEEFNKLKSDLSN